MLLEGRLGDVPLTIGTHQRSIAHVAAYWSGQGNAAPLEAFRRALRKFDRDVYGLTIADLDYLATLDEFHCLGIEGTRDMAQLLRVVPHMRVLDLGCGLGGPSRRLAVDYDCHVTGVDITKDFLLIAENINRSMGLSNQIQLTHADITKTSFGEEAFDLAWMQVAAANVRERHELYRGVWAALRPGALFGIFDIFSDDDCLIKYPVPWGVDQSTSALLSASETVSALKKAGFRIVNLQDVSGRACKWFEAEVKYASELLAAPRLDFCVVLRNWPEMAENQVQNLRSGAITFCYLVAKKI